MNRKVLTARLARDSLLDMKGKGKFVHQSNPATAAFAGFLFFGYLEYRPYAVPAIGAGRSTGGYEARRNTGLAGPWRIFSRCRAELVLLEALRLLVGRWRSHGPQPPIASE